MKKHILTIIAALFFSICYAQNNIDTKKLIKDFDFAVEQLQLQHQGFYNYEESSKVDSQIVKLRGEINSPMTKLEFYQLIRKLLGVMNEGHGSVELPKWTMITTGLSKSFLPFTVRFLDEKLILTQYYGETIDGLAKGVRIISINGKSINEIIEKLTALIPTDGFNETSKYEWIGGTNFTLLYRLVYGGFKRFEVEFIEPNHDKTQLIKLPAIKYTKFKAKNAKFESKRFNYSNFKYEQINDTIAYLSIPTFGHDDWDYPQLYKKVFTKISDAHIKHLILDIQANGGGTEGNENLLFQYLSENKIRKYRTVTMLPKPYSKNQNDKDYIFDKWELKDTIAVRGEYTCFSDYLSDLGYSKPDKKYIYTNKLYVLISGMTFSGGAEFASMIKMTNRGIFIGEETGGAYEGNVSGYSETVKLPHTRIKLNIPTVHFQMDVLPAQRGRGIIPDYEVPQTWQDYLNNRNSKLEFTKKLIMH